MLSKERDHMQSRSTADTVNDFKEAFEAWGRFEWLNSQAQHLIDWKDALA